MRVSSNFSYDIGVAAMNRQQAAQAKTLEQISSGKRNLTPSDDPAAYVRALGVSQADASNTQYAANRQSAASSLSALDGTLGNVTTLVQNAQQLAVYAGNGTLSDSDRAAIATQLRGNLDELMSLANSTDANWQYLFSGFQGSTKPFVDTGTGVKYMGDDGQRLVQASTSRQLAVNESGRDVFERIPAAGGGNQSLFKTLGDLINVLQTPVATDADKTSLTNGLSAAQGNLSNSLDKVLQVRSGVGTRMNEVDTLNTAGDDLSLQYKQQLADLQGIDYAKAISDLTQQQTYLQATQQAFLKVRGLSLFDYLK